MQPEKFEQLVGEAYASLPDRIQEKIKNVALVVEDEPSEEERRVQGLSPHQTLFGLYVGVPLIVRGSSYGLGPTLPDKIIIYRKPIVEAAGGDPDIVRRLIIDTVYHEFAHHFGMSEAEVRDREKKGW